MFSIIPSKDTHTATLLDITTNAEESIVYQARVSNPSNQHNTQTSAKLIRYLIKHKHWSPFEMAHMTVEVKTTRSVAAQILRHRSFSFQEQSQRYASPTTLVLPQLRKRGSSNRQSSVPFEDELKEQTLLKRVETHLNASADLYTFLKASGVANECAREILPLATETTLYMSGSIRSWLHYVQVRDTPNTQEEHRRVAQAVRGLLKDNLPHTYEAMFEPPTLPTVPQPSPCSKPFLLNRFYSFLALLPRFS